MLASKADPLSVLGLPAVQAGIVDGVVQAADRSLWALLSSRLAVRRYDSAANLWQEAVPSDGASSAAGCVKELASLRVGSAASK